MATTETIAHTFETVTAYLVWDRRQVGTRLAAVCSSVRNGRFEAARREFDGYERHLTRHLRIEEELIFPVFEARSGIVGGPTAVMRDEHRQVRKAVALMRAGLEKSDATEYDEGCRFLDSVLPDHDAKEEHILYPALDVLLSAPERAALVARLERE